MTRNDIHNYSFRYKVDNKTAEEELLRRHKDTRCARKLLQEAIYGLFELNGLQRNVFYKYLTVRGIYKDSNQARMQLAHNGAGSKQLLEERIVQRYKDIYFAFQDFKKGLK